MLHHDIGMLWVKLIGIGSKEYICVIKKFGVLKFQFHILHKLLIRRLLFYNKLDIAAITLQHFVHIYLSAFKGDLQIE